MFNSICKTFIEHELQAITGGKVSTSERWADRFYAETICGYAACARCTRDYSSYKQRTYELAPNIRDRVSATG